MRVSREVEHAAWRCALALLLLVPVLGLPVPLGEAGEDLVDLDEKRLERTDQFGLAWDPQVDGMLLDGSNDCFDGGLELKVNGKTFSPTLRKLMTRDASELVLRGRVGRLEVTRRVRFDLDQGAARYVEVFHNKTSRALPVAVTLTSALGGRASQVVTNTGDPMAGGMFEREEFGIVAFQQGGNRPSVLFVLSTPGSPVDPTIQIEDARRFVVSWNLTVPAHGSVAVLHSIAQRRWDALPAGDSLLAEFAPFVSVDWAAGLPQTIGDVLANFRGGTNSGGTIADGGPADQEVRALIERYDLDDDEGAVLFVQQNESLHGSASGEGLKVETRYGVATLDLAEVALIRGGANLGRSMRTYLRNGEVLVGEIQAPGLAFASPSGLSLPIEPAGIDALFLPRREDDGTPSSGTASFLKHLDGSKLALVESAAPPLEVATPWGDLRIPRSHVLSLEYVREPRPGLRIELDDGSRFPSSLAGDDLTFQSLRFGDISIQPGAITQWNRYGIGPVMLAKYHKATGPARTHIALRADIYLVGLLDLSALTMRTGAAASALPLKGLYHVERSTGEEGDFGACTWYMRTGSKVSAVLGDKLLPFLTPFGRCWIPAQHVVGYRVGSDPGVARAAPPAPQVAAPEADEAGGDR